MGEYKEGNIPAEENPDAVEQQSFTVEQAALPAPDLMQDGIGAEQGTEQLQQESPPIDIDAILPPELIAPLCSMPFEWAASHYGEYWKLSAKEQELLGKATSNVLKKYLPEWLKNNGEVAMLMLTVAMITAPRLMNMATQQKQVKHGDA